MMLDLNKEREAFERFHAKECNCSYEDLKRQLDRQEALTGHRYLPTSPRHEAWLIWDAAWQEKAKAQAVPETHLLIPKEPNRKTIMAMACVCLGSVGSGAEFLTLKEAKDVYSALVEKESGAE